MFTSTAKSTSTRASIYLRQLYKHFGHKAQLRFAPSWAASILRSVNAT